MTTDNNAIQVVARSLLVEIVVPAVPPELARQVQEALNGSNGRFQVAEIDLKEDGYHLQIRARVRDQGLLQQALQDLANKLKMSLRDPTTSS
jgi:hypothetical protein